MRPRYLLVRIRKGRVTVTLASDDRGEVEKRFRKLLLGSIDGDCVRAWDFLTGEVWAREDIDASDPGMPSKSVRYQSAGSGAALEVPG